MNIDKLSKKNKTLRYSFRLSTKEIAFMGILFSLYIVTKFVFSIILKGPLNVSIETIFWIFNGIIFGAIKGPLFSIVCDTVLCFFTTGIAYWMVEYAIIAPLISLISFFLWHFFENSGKKSIFLPVSILLTLIIFSIILFFVQLFNGEFKYEGISSDKILPSLIYFIICFLCVSILTFMTSCLVLYKKRNDVKYIKWIQSLAIIVLITIIFRWVWGPYAFTQFYKRFISSNIDFSKKYLITLSGIVMKTCLTIPISITIFVPTIEIIKKFKINVHQENKFD